MTNADIFLDHFNTIERHLRDITGIGREKSFSVLVNAAQEKNRVVRHYRNDLYKFGDLRNAIVHERDGNRVIADPNDWAVQRIRAIAEQITQPPLVLPSFAGEVLTLSDTDPIAVAVTAMHAHAYSQLPIYRGNTFQGLLTTNTVARWLGANVDEDLVSLSETTIGQVLAHTEDPSHVAFVSRNTTLVDVLEQFLAYEAHGKRLEALIITHDGRHDAKPLGMIVTYDLAKISRLLDV